MLNKHLSSIAALVCLGLLATAGEAAPRRTAKSASKAPAVRTASVPKGAPAKAKASTAATKSGHGSTYSASRRRPGGTRTSNAKSTQASASRTTHSAVQYGPSADRYREIQQALSDKGYYKGAVDGSWNSESQDALRRFQADQKLTGTGKLDSRSLIALGLGPKRDNAAATINAGGVSQ